MNLGKPVALGITTAIAAGGTAVAMAVGGSPGDDRKATAVAQGADNPAVSDFECPVTEPPTPAFVAPEPYPARPSADGMVWFGTESLWTALPADGWFMIAGIDPDEPGCWRVTAAYSGVELSYVYNRP